MSLAEDTKDQRQVSPLAAKLFPAFSTRFRPSGSDEQLMSDIGLSAAVDYVLERAAQKADSEMYELGYYFSQRKEITDAIRSLKHTPDSGRE